MSATQKLPAQLALPSASPRSPVEKAAAVLALLDEKTLHTLQGKVSPRHREKLAEAVKSMRAVPQAELRQIAKEFTHRLSREHNAVRGSDDIAQRLTENLFEQDEEPEQDFEEPQSADLEEMLAQLDQTPFWEKIEKIPPKKLIAYFEDKSPTVLGIAMQMLSPDISSELAGELDGDLVREAILMMATSGRPNPLAVEAVEEMLDKALLAKSPTGGDDAAADDEGNPNADAVAGILNRLTNKRRENVLEALNATLDGDNMGEIASKVLSFEALEYRLPRNAIPVIFREVAEKELLTAMKYALSLNNPVADYMLNNISQRLAATYREKMEEMTDIEEEDGEKAQSAVICKLLAMVEDGRVELLDAPDEREREKPVEE